jgi:endonuclease YncB( thermonuclease family)
VTAADPKLLLYTLALPDGKTVLLDPYIRWAKVIEVIDGDTLGFQIDLGFSVHVGNAEEDDPVVLRLDGGNCPESSGPDATPEGTAAKEFTTKTCPVGTRVLVRTRKVKSRKSGALLDKKEKYGRYLAQVFIPRPDGTLVDLVQILLQTGHAKPYSGGKR